MCSIWRTTPITRTSRTYYLQGIRGMDVGSEYIISIGVRLERAGCTLVYIPECIINQILETHSPVCDFETWGKPQERKQKERLLLDGKMHFANELLIQELGLNPARTQPLGNEFSLRGLRDHALRTGDFPTHNSLEV